MSNPERGDATAPSTLSGHKRLFIAPARSGDSRRCVVRLTSAPPPAKRPLWTTGVRDAALARSPLRRPVVLAARSLARVRNACSIDLAGHLARRRDEVIPQSHATATLASYASADRSFLEFCEVLGLDFDSFGLPLADGGYAVWEEDEILGLWLIYGCENPRRQGLAHVTAETMFKFLSGLRHSVQLRHKRRPGRPVVEAHDLRLVQRGLSKLYPSGQETPREPILRAHLVAVRGELDLAHSQLDRVREQAMRVLSTHVPNPCISR